MNAVASGQRESVWFEQALAALAGSGPTGQISAEYIEQRRISLGFSRQKHTGASWFDWRRLRRGIFLNARYAGRRSDDPTLCALIAHEAKHQEQGMVEALSVRGELVAWQLQYDVLAGFSAAPSNHLWQQLLALQADSRADLEQARALMGQIAGPGYRIGWLPLWPLPAEVAHWMKNLCRR
jgi:hypothetical protein